MKVKAVKCNECGDTIYSRCCSDERFCRCRGLLIYNGYKSPSLSGLNKERVFYNVVDIEVNADEQELLNDYLLGNNEFGIIYTNGKTKFMQLEKID